MTPMLSSVFDSIYDQRQDESVQRRDQLSKLTQNEHGLSQKILNSKPCNKIWHATQGALDVQNRVYRNLAKTIMP